jgi:D-amino-acid dehydrogenase
MDVIVIGGGIVGVATAYQLRAAGHRVCVVERHATVAQGATYGHGGIVLPTPLDAWFGPTFLGSRRGVVYRPGLNSSARRFARQLASLQPADAFRAQWQRLRPLVELSREAIASIEAGFHLEFEQHEGVLHVTRDPREWGQAQAALDLLGEFEMHHNVLSAAECAEAERSIPTEPAFAGGVMFPQERTANCPLFTKLVKQVLDEQGGVQFLFGRAVEAIRLENERAAVELAPAEGERKSAREVDVVSCDAIVVAGGAGSKPLLERLGLSLPFHPIRMLSLTAPIAYEECAPHLTVVDSVRRISMTRMNQRIRAAGAAVLQPERELDKPLSESLVEAGTALLAQSTHDWIPGAAKISAAHAWEGLRLLSPDGLPVVGNAVHPRLFVNCGHGPAGWGLACGSAKVIADLISETAPSVPPDTLSALRPERFAS